MQITEAWLRGWAAKNGGGWSGAQLEAIGEKWPPRRGWLKRAIGREIDDKQRQAFEESRITGSNPNTQVKRERRVWQKRVLKLAQKRIYVRGHVNTLVRHLRAAVPDAPVNLSGYYLLEWYCQTSRTRPLGLLQPFIRPVRGQADLRGGDDFLSSYEWRRLRMEIIKTRGARCECCGATPIDGVTVIHVDHIKPRQHHPELALDPSNLQVLCHVCNHGKGNWDETDWRVGPATASSVPRSVSISITSPSCRKSASPKRHNSPPKQNMEPRLVRKEGNAHRGAFITAADQWSKSQHVKQQSASDNGEPHDVSRTKAGEGRTVA